MRPLLANEILEVWEAGQHLHPIDKALTLLGAGCPEIEPAELANMSIGRRDTLLFNLREAIFGPRLNAFSECPMCHEQLEFSLDTNDLLANNMTPEDPESTLETENFKIRYRLPTSLDLAKSINSGAAESDKVLLARCIIRVNRNDKEVETDALPDTVITALASEIRQRDPLTEIELELSCPGCGHRWPVVLDIISFFWIELETQAKALLHQVHTLARSYGWREADILSMSPRRRQYYLDMVTA
jgi:hypothetical protein